MQKLRLLVLRSALICPNVELNVFLSLRVIPVCVDSRTWDSLGRPVASSCDTRHLSRVLLHEPLLLCAHNSACAALRSRWKWTFLCTRVLLGSYHRDVLVVLLALYYRLK